MDQADNEPLFTADTDDDFSFFHLKSLQFEQFRGWKQGKDDDRTVLTLYLLLSFIHILSGILWAKANYTTVSSDQAL